MEYICEHIKKIREPYNDEDLEYNIMEYEYEKDMTLNQIRKILNRKIGKSIRNVKVYPENHGIHKKVFMTFRYKKLECSIYEYFDTKRDYLCLSIKLDEF
jgi:hypothetical protein